MGYAVHEILQAGIIKWALSLLQGIFPTQGWNPGLPTLQVDSLPAEPPGKPITRNITQSNGISLSHKKGMK